MLSVKPGWAWALLHAGRDVENRSWRAGLASGTLLGIHAASSVSQVEHAAITAMIQRLSGQQVPTLDELRATGQRGALVGVVTVEGWVEESASPWFVGPHGLVVREPRVLARPWRVRGQQKFFKRQVPTEVAQELGLLLATEETPRGEAPVLEQDSEAEPEQLGLW